MLRNWLRRAVRFVVPAAQERTVVLGTQPGMVWEPARSRWVPEETTWEPGAGTYTLVGPVYRPVGLQP